MMFGIPSIFLKYLNITGMIWDDTEFGFVFHGFLPGLQEMPANRRMSALLQKSK
jgi:hypothetical protein